MKTHKSSYAFVNLTSAGNVACTGENTVEFNNDGTATVIIDGVHEIQPGDSKDFGGRLESGVEQTFAITFSATGTKFCQVVKETVEAL